MNNFLAFLKKYIRYFLFASIAQLARVPPCHGGRCGFESHCSLQKNLKNSHENGGFWFFTIVMGRESKEKYQLLLVFFQREPGDGGESRVPLLAPFEKNNSSRKWGIFISCFFCYFSYILCILFLERSHSGLVHTLGKGAYRKISGVRISLSPPLKKF